MGGTGKTPTVKHVTELLGKNGYRPAVISRGYGGNARDRVNVVSDGNGLKMTAFTGGDEPVMLARMLKNIPVLTGKKRVYPCKTAVSKYKRNVLILDDGFQHLAVKRDIDIVLFDATTLAGNSRVFPGGDLREPVSAMKRADAVLITGVTEVNKQRAEKFANLLRERFSALPVFFANHGEYSLYCDEKKCSPHNFAEPHYAFCGIANPARFKKSLEICNIKINGFTAYKDHMPYNQKIVATLCENARRSGVDHLVTTEKDFVKLRSFSWQLPLRVLKINEQVEKEFDDLILKLMSQ